MFDYFPEHWRFPFPGSKQYPVHDTVVGKQDNSSQKSSRDANNVLQYGSIL